MHPHRVLLLVFFLNEVLLVHLVVNKGVRVTEFVTRMGRSYVSLLLYELLFSKVVCNFAKICYTVAE